MQVALLSRPTSKKVDSVDIFEPKAEQAYGNAFAVFCFSGDLHHTQDSWTKPWKDCAAGQTSVVAATVVTQAARNTIRRAEQELCVNLLPNQLVNDCYEALARTMVMTDTINKGLNPIEEGVDITPFDDFIFLSDLQAFLSTTTYAIVTFWTDYDGTQKKIGLEFVKLAREHAELGILVFARANADDMRQLALRYCRWEGKQSFFFLKDGKQVAVNGQPYIQGPKTKALKAATEKLGALVKKRLVKEQQESVDQGAAHNMIL